MKNIRKRIGDRSAYFFVAPAVLLMGIFIVYPLLSSVRLSMTNWSGLGTEDFVGFANYIQLAKDPAFWESIKLQFIWAVLSVIFLALVGMALALFVDIFIPVKALIPVARTVLFMPMMMSLVAIGLLWSMIYNPMIGILNELLHVIGILRGTQTLDLLGDDKLALYAAFLPCVWQWSGFGMVIFSAAMQGISSEILEASVMDGCTKIGQVRHIILPLMKPTIATVCTINLIGGLKCFDLIYVMTAGGPGTSTQVTSIYIFKQAFTNSYYGYSSALSFVLFLVTAVFGAIFFKLTQRLEA